MAKKIWIMNHYAIKHLEDQGGRHFWIANQLKKDGYEPIVFGCNEKGDCNDSFYKFAGLWDEISSDEGVKYITIKSTHYFGNGKDRIKNMIVFAHNLKKVAKQYAKQKGKPDIIYASSVHPLTVLVGESLAKYFNVPCIGEVRDLWPETLVAYGAVKRFSLLGRALYFGEKIMYKRADALVFTMEGAPSYICEHGWDTANGGPINLNNVHHICNGVDIRQFDINRENNDYFDSDLDDPNIFCVVYTGAVRKANNLGLLLDTTSYLRDLSNLKILVWGNGYEIDMLKEKAESMGLSEQFVFKGYVEKKYIPSIVSRSDINIMHWERTSVNNYGYDYNKLFEYLAAGQPVFSTIQSGYSLLKTKNCGIETNGDNPKDFAEGIRMIYNMSHVEREEWGKRAREAALDYDFNVLTQQLETIIDDLYRGESKWEQF